jgi:hypothetical protein
MYNLLALHDTRPIVGGLTTTHNMHPATLAIKSPIKVLI